MDKKGIVKKRNDELLLIAGSKITTIDCNGEVIEYLLTSDTVVVLSHDARLL